MLSLTLNRSDWMPLRETAKWILAGVLQLPLGRIFLLAVCARANRKRPMLLQSVEIAVRAPDIEHIARDYRRREQHSDLMHFVYSNNHVIVER